MSKIKVKSISEAEQKNVSTVHNKCIEISCGLQGSYFTKILDSHDNGFEYFAICFIMSIESVPIAAERRKKDDFLCGR